MYEKNTTDSKWLYEIYKSSWNLSFLKGLRLAQLGPKLVGTILYKDF